MLKNASSKLRRLQIRQGLRVWYEFCERSDHRVEASITRVWCQIRPSLAAIRGYLRGYAAGRSVGLVHQISHLDAICD